MEVQKHGLYSIMCLTFPTVRFSIWLKIITVRVCVRCTCVLSRYFKHYYESGTCYYFKQNRQIYSSSSEIKYSRTMIFVSENNYFCYLVNGIGEK